MKLYEIPRDSKILIDIRHTVTGEEKQEMCTFHHIDGMYSLITTPDDVPVHLGASTEVNLVNDHYEIA
jgi:hypothetical protein